MSNSESSGAGIAAVRGAVSVASNTVEDILGATARLLSALVEANRLERSRIVSAFFTATDDLDADFPAHAARRLGWTDVPLLCVREMRVPGAMPRVVRVLLTVTGVAPGERLVPVYMDGAAALRPDLASRKAGSPGAEPNPRGRPGADAAEARAAPRRTSAQHAGGRDAGGRPSTEARAADAESKRLRRIAIVGLGQIGGSIALALGRRGGWWRVGFDRDPSVWEQARARGAVDEIAESLESACARVDLAVLATPVDTLPDLVERAAGALPRGAALLDTGSSRRGVTGALDRAAARGVGAVGGHPLAGSEGRGFAAARAEIFEGTAFALCPAGAQVPEIVDDLVRDLGARAIRVAPDDHDHALARTSHLPYLIACALRGAGEAAAARGLTGPGYRDMTRLAASDARMALAYCRANAREVAVAWRELRGMLDARVAELGEAGRQG